MQDDGSVKAYKNEFNTDTSFLKVSGEKRAYILNKWLCRERKLIVATNCLHLLLTT